ncbi:hypothetical protein AB0P05_38005 [Streptomyces flaveolus]|uniref:wHTH domain-containing protein n=1 Tax=Streptomyces flaveolus TaxID=67297 RepID=UPI00342CA65F
MTASRGGPGGRERRFRALLVGVGRYNDPLFRPMPFITTELRALAEALKEHGGYQEAEVREADDWYGPQLRREVEHFVEHAAPGDHLLLVLSGHGFHEDGSDYLVTGPAVRSSQTFKETCLRIEFGGFLQHSGADQFVVAVDACRAPLDEYVKGGDAFGWSKGDTGYRADEIMDQPRYAHVYACTRYNKAGFKPAAGPYPEDTRDDGVVEESKGFSYFTKALTQIARDGTAPGLLDELEPALDERVRAIAREDRGDSDQCVQITYATGKEDLLLFPDRGPGARRAGEHPWEEKAREHEAWRRVRRPEGLTKAETEQAVAQLREAVARLVGLWGHDTDEGDAWLAGHGDVWRPAGTESRMGPCVETMLRNADKSATDLSLTEAALLVAGPFLYTAFGTRLAYLARNIRPWTLVDGTPAGEERGFATREAFERYCGAHQALQDRERRARERGRDAEAHAVAWWLARQWLMRLPASRAAVERSGLAGFDSLPDEPEFEPWLVREVLRPVRLRSLAGLIGLDLEQRRPARLDTVTALRRTEHTADWERIATLLTVAHHMAVDPVLLPSLVAEHLGVSDPVDGQEFRETLRGLTWQPESPGRVLSADCAHEAVELALREHTDALDSTVRAVLRGPAGARVTAWGVPVAYGAGRVGPAPGEGRQPRYHSADVRFRLDGDRVRDLLMGEQLYQDRTLALRELYQNALDACRYRRARTQLLNLRNPDNPDHWQGEITFVQGEENGRAYIECRDNGIGMGRHELRHLFAFAGSRFVEEREFLEERGKWAEENIPFQPNSRFGIGVLSYFMLADEIQVITSRMPREGGYGERLEVGIDGPGVLFRVRETGLSRPPGTTVRLYLRNPDDHVSCGKVLREHLWVSDFSVVVREQGQEPLRWRPMELSEYVGVVPADSLDDGPDRDGAGPAVQDAGDGVWWCPGHGAVLADGLWAGEARFGAVVNLTGEHAPTLRLDRGAMLDDHEEYVAGLLAEKIPVLFEEGGRVLSLDWLDDLVQGGPRPFGARKAESPGQGELANRIAAQAAARGHRFRFRTFEQAEVVADASVLGCCPGDSRLVRTRRSGAPAVLTDDADLFTEWRARVWAAADPAAGVVPRSPLPAARPTDQVFMNHVAREEGTIAPPGALVAAARSCGMAIEQVADRMRELGIEVPDEPVLRRLADLYEDQAARLVRLLSRDRDGLHPWLPWGQQLDIGQIISRRASDSEDPRALAGLLATLGFRVPADEEFDRPPTRRRWPPARKDLLTLLLRQDFDPEGPELPRDRPVPPVHLAMAVSAFPDLWDVITETLMRAGHRLPPDLVPDPDLDPALVSRFSNGRAPWRSPYEPVSLGDLLVLADELRMSPERVAQRCEVLGFVPPQLPGEDERRVLERLLVDLHRNDRIDPQGDSGKVEPDVVLTLARRHAREDREIARLLGILGYSVRGLDEHPGQPRDHLDMALTSLDEEGGPPWLDVERRVPWHYVLRGADTYRLTTEEVVERLARCGYDVAPEPPGGDWAWDDDLFLLRNRSRHLGYMWHAVNTPVPLTHILHTAHRLNRTPIAVAARLEQLGHVLPEDVEFTEPAVR